MSEYLLSRVQSMADSTQAKPWQHEMAFNYARRALMFIDPASQEAVLLRATIEMAWPEFPLDIPEASA